MEFEPKILGFLCNWCSYAGADLAGVSRIQYPSSLRVIRVMCSGLDGGREQREDILPLPGKKLFAFSSLLPPVHWSQFR